MTTSPTNQNTSGGGNGNLKKASSLRHTNIRSPIYISSTAVNQPNVGSGNTQHSPGSAFQSISLNNKPANQFNSNYLIKKKVLSSSPVSNLSSGSCINNSLGSTTKNSNGLCDLIEFHILIFLCVTKDLNIFSLFLVLNIVASLALYLNIGYRFS